MISTVIITYIRNMRSMIIITVGKGCFELRQPSISMF